MRHFLTFDVDLNWAEGLQGFLVEDRRQHLTQYSAEGVRLGATSEANSTTPQRIARAPFKCVGQPCTTHDSHS